MRIGIREQFAAVVLFTALVPLMVLSIATWINNHDFVTGLTSQQLALTASLKASQISSDLLLIQSTCSTITTRVLIQNAIRNYYKGNVSESNWTSSSTDIKSALAGGGLSELLQVAIFSRNATGNSTSLFRATGDIPGIIIPNAISPNGSKVLLGQEGFGYPPALYPNITYTPTSSPDPADPRVNATKVAAFSDFPLNSSSVLVLGPLQINNTYALLSMTLPIVDNRDPEVVLGFMTVVAAATSLLDIIYQYREGLAKTGIVLLVSTNRKENLFRYEQKPATEFRQPTAAALNSAPVKYVFPPYGVGEDRHKAYLTNFTRYGSSNFSMGSYPAAVAGFGVWNDNPNNAGSLLTTRNEDGSSVSVGYARPQSDLVDWLLIVEQTHKEAWAPVEKLRMIVLACVFGSIGLILLVLVPTAHYSVLPILRLKAATTKSITPPGYTPNGSIRCGRGDGDGDHSDSEPDLERTQSRRSKKGLFIRLRRMAFGGGMQTSSNPEDDDRRRGFKIPAKVQDQKHFITDELTELTATFNEMTEELMVQYTSLEDKVAERTRELEISKKAAEAANESKTLFIANISHELKTPLNGILGMCAVCMGEDDLPRIKKSLQVVYKSGDLLLHLLNDLLTFSKNQIGQQLSLEEREFRLNDIKTQIVTIFTKQVQEKNIHFSVKFVGTDTELDSTEAMSEKTKLPALGPQGTGRLKDMHLWGDQHRILQVIINLVSNSLKFTPAGGKVLVRIKCLGEGENSSDRGRNSLGSKQSKQNSLRGPRGRHDSGSNASQVSRMPSNSSSKPSGTALQINPMDPKAAPRVQVRERSPTPPPLNAQTLLFQFEVEDSGPGIPESLQDRVFEPFVQGDLGLSKKYGGTGLGLSICSQLSQLMGGTITLTSSQTPPTGTTFKVQIPLRHTKSRAPSTSSSDVHGHSRPNSVYINKQQVDAAVSSGSGTPSTSARKSGDFQKDNQPRLVGLSQPFFATNSTTTPDSKSKKGELSVLNKVANGKESVRKLRVLVAEDNLVNQEIVIRMLKLEHLYDVEVVVAQDGKEAYDIVKKSMESGQYFNLIFMDIQMPNLDGLQSTKLIRQMGYSAPIVALTAFSEESNVKECYDSGMDHFLSKPIRRPALKQVLKRFTTIPEEAETSSGKSTPSEHDASSRELGTPATSQPSAADATTSTAIDTVPPAALVNGTSPSKEAPP